MIRLVPIILLPFLLLELGAVYRQNPVLHEIPKYVSENFHPAAQAKEYLCGPGTPAPRNISHQAS
jgi:hypothetical protein